MIVTTQLVTKQHSPDTNIRKNTLQLLAKKNTLPYVNINEECKYITGNNYNYSTHLKTENLLQKLAKKNTLPKWVSTSWTNARWLDALQYKTGRSIYNRESNLL